MCQQQAMGDCIIRYVAQRRVAKLLSGTSRQLNSPEPIAAQELAWLSYVSCNANDENMQRNDVMHGILESRGSEVVVQESELSKTPHGTCALRIVSRPATQSNAPCLPTLATLFQAYR